MKIQIFTILFIITIFCISCQSDKSKYDEKLEKTQKDFHTKQMEAYKKLEADGHGYIDPDTGNFIWKRKRLGK